MAPPHPPSHLTKPSQPQPDSPDTPYQTLRRYKTGLFYTFAKYNKIIATNQLYQLHSLIFLSSHTHGTSSHPSEHMKRHESPQETPRAS